MGLISVVNGAFFLPNSVLVKSSDNLLERLLTGGISGYAEWFSSLARGAFPVFLMVAVSAVLLVVQRRRGVGAWDSSVLFPGVMVAVSSVHLLLGQTGWFFRYEAYMVALLSVGITVQLVRSLERQRDRRPASVILWALVAVLLTASVVAGYDRARLAWESTPRATENVYEQMYQTAHFIRANPQYTSVAIGDLGAVAYYNGGKRRAASRVETIGSDGILKPCIAAEAIASLELESPILGGPRAAPRQNLATP